MERGEQERRREKRRETFEFFRVNLGMFSKRKKANSILHLILEVKGTNSEESTTGENPHIRRPFNTIAHIPMQEVVQHI